MHTNTWLRFVSPLAALLLHSNSISAATLASDDFGSNTHPTGLPTASASTGLSFFTRDADTAVSASIVNDSTFGSPALTVSDTLGSGQKPIIAALPMTIQLANVGDYIQLEFSFRYLTAASVDKNSNFRFGFYDSNGTPTTANGQSTGGVYPSENDTGYYVQIGSGTTAPNVSNVFWNETSGSGPILAGTDRQNVASNSAGFAINNTLSHTALFRVSRNTATTMRMDLSIDGATSIFGTDSALLRTSFNEIAFSNGASSPALNFAIDNVLVTSSIPEPGILGLATVAFAAAFSRRWRRG